MKLGLKTVKGKIIAGTAAGSLVLGGGFAFANTDAGQALQDWYNGQFDSAVQDGKEDAAAYGASLLPGLAQEYNGLKSDAKTDINETADSETTDAENAINSAKEDHIEAVTAKKVELLSEAEKAFYDVYMDAWLQIQDLGDQGYAYAENDLTKYTGDAGSKAVSQVKTDLDAAKENAVSELEEAIENAKGELQADLDDREANLTYNLKNQIDFEINDLRKQVESLLEDLVAEQQSIIASKAQELENGAIDALDEVVAGIDGTDGK
ncbi:hypothetical protein [Virgibacillus ihumii]|uniref:hypothetical protein n=1 Tax=Virgibacillus ihumii TaxID=2686091 RepID=UPI00157BFF7E|nr:hypothetical protein [Virgibacillus ihumii]